MKKTQKTHIGKFLSLILRHNPKIIGIQLDDQGWALVSDLLEGLKTKGYILSFSELELIVNTDNKNRYRFNADKTAICANQGHSLCVDLALKAVVPPEVLYHGTACCFIDSIKQQGLVKKSRHHVHCSMDKKTAMQVGSRHGKPVILTILAGKMHREGHLFYRSMNDVWLVDYISPDYFLLEG